MVSGRISVAAVGALAAAMVLACLSAAAASSREHAAASECGTRETPDRAERTPQRGPLDARCPTDGCEAGPQAAKTGCVRSRHGARTGEAGRDAACTVDERLRDVGLPPLPEGWDNPAGDGAPEPSLPSPPPPGP
jgi:hypothetical protein